MRALVGILLALSLLAQAADARVLVARKRTQTNLLDVPGEQVEQERSVWGMFQRIMELTGSEYVEAPWNTVRTEDCRTASLPVAGGTDSLFDAVIHWDWRGGTVFGNNAYRPDSLVRSDVTLQVPQLAIGTNQYVVSMTDAQQTMFSSTSVCTTGVTGEITRQAGYSGVYYPGNTGTVYMPTLYGTSYSAGGAAPYGGVRNLLKMNQVSILQSTGACVWSNDPDSLFAGGADDSLVLWELPWTGNAAAGSPFVFCMIGGAGATNDSIADTLSTARPAAENDPLVMLMGLARLDSLTGGQVFGNKLPLEMALTIDGGFRRQNRGGWTGGFAGDSAVIKARIADLASRRIPAVLGVNVDSLDAYAYEKAWWKAWPQLKYSPQSWHMVADSTAAVGDTTASSERLIDIFGHLRKRAAYGPVGTTAADTSIYALLAYARNRVKAAFPGRSSNTLLPPLDDLVPANSGMHSDSVLYAASLLGYEAVRVNGKHRDGTRAGAGFGRPPNPLNDDDTQSWRYVHGRRIKQMAHLGYNMSGGDRWSHSWWAVNQSFPDVARDTTCAAGTGRLDVHLVNGQRMTTGLTGRYVYEAFQDDQLRNSYGVTEYYDDYFVRRAQRGSVMRLCVNDLGGDANGPPPSGGYLAVVNLDNAFRIINALAGRTVITWAYPEDIEP